MGEQIQKSAHAGLGTILILRERPLAGYIRRQAYGCSGLPQIPGTAADPAKRALPQDLLFMDNFQATKFSWSIFVQHTDRISNHMNLQTANAGFRYKITEAEIIEIKDEKTMS